MKKHYWTWPIAIYLFLGGLGGGILTLTWLFEMIFGIGETFVLGVFIGVLALGVGCFFLVFELGQPLVFLRVFIASKAIIKWGAVLLSVALIFGFVYFISFLGWGFTDIFIPMRGFALALAGITGACVMLYTGVLLASLKAHSFWNSPALPVLFTVSALSTGSAMLALTAGMWPSGQGVLVALVAHEMLHSLDLALVFIELLVLMVYVLLMLGAGNVVASKVARRWVTGSFAPVFWIGMIGCGLVVPLLCYLGGGFAASILAPILVLAGGLLLRFLVVFSDDRRMIPGEESFYDKLPKGDEEFLTAWKNKENLY